MKFFIIILLCLCTLAGATLAVAYVCFYMAFFVNKRQLKENLSDEFRLPKGKIYEPYREQMLSWMNDVRKLPFKSVSIQSFDGLTLTGKYYEFSPTAPIELMMHGYRGNSETDLCGGVERSFSLGHSALVIDQRGCKNADGRVISFGINESRDCISWVRFIKENINKNAKIILTGISMGGTTVLLAAPSLKGEIVGVLADCPFDSAKTIICKVIDDMKLPSKLLYPFVFLGAFIFGRINLNRSNALKSVAEIDVPLVFIHGKADDFVPHTMTEKLFENANEPKTILLVDGAGHGLSYIISPESYLETLKKGFEKI